MKEISAGAIVLRKNKEINYLLLHYEAGHWDFPKGNVEKNEDEKDTVRREIKEETGIENIEFIDGFKEKINYFYKRDNQTIFKQVIFYLVKTKEKKVKISYEHIGYKWFDYDNALKQITYKNSKAILEKAHKFLNSKFVNNFFIIDLFL